MKQWDQVMAASISFTGHWARLRTQGHLSEKSRGEDCIKGLAMPKFPSAIVVFAETFPALQMARFMKGWRCAANSFITIQGVRHNLWSNEKREYFTEYIPSLASQEYPFYESVVYAPLGVGGWVTILGTDSRNSQLSCVLALECMGAVTKFGFLIWNDTWYKTVP